MRCFCFYKIFFFQFFFCSDKIRSKNLKLIVCEKIIEEEKKQQIENENERLKRQYSIESKNPIEYKDSQKSLQQHNQTFNQNNFFNCNTKPTKEFLFSPRETNCSTNQKQEFFSPVQNYEKIYNKEFVLSHFNSFSQKSEPRKQISDFFEKRNIKTIITINQNNKIRHKSVKPISIFRSQIKTDYDENKTFQSQLNRINKKKENKILEKNYQDLFLPEIKKKIINNT